MEVLPNRKHNKIQNKGFKLHQEQHSSSINWRTQIFVLVLNLAKQDEVACFVNNYFESISK